MSANDDDADEAQTGAFMRALQRVVAIKPGELRSIAWSWLYFFSLLASTARGIPRWSMKSANRRTPQKASRTISKVHRSPMISSERAREQACPA